MIAAAAKKEEGRPGESGPQINTQCREEHCERKFNAGEPGAQVAKFSALVSSRPMGKRVWLEGGVLRKEVRRPQKVFTHVPVEVASIEDLADAFGQANSQTVFVTGLHPSEEGVQIRRDKAEFGLDHGAGVMFLDNDTHPGGDQFASLYAKGCPALAGASYVHSPSSGAYIYDTDGLEVVGAKGQHYAVPVLDAADTPRAIEALHERCILAGLGVAAISASGLVRIKSPVDTAMATVQQPLFHGVDAIGGLVQRKKPHIKAHQGRAFLFDTRLIKSLSASERTQLQAIEDDLRQQVEQEASQIRERWLADREAEVSFANAVSLGEARAKLEKTLHLSAGSGANIDLWAGMKIQFDKLGLVDVADVLADPDRYHGQTCDDPMEPSYKPGTQVAICYSKSKDGTPHPHPGIHSFAHGARNVYHLKRDLRHIVTDLEAAERAHVARLAVGQGVGGSNAEEGLQGDEGSISAVSSDLAGLHAPLARPDATARQVFGVGEFMTEFKPMHWVWQKVLAKGWFYALAAKPGSGKTAVALLLALRVAMGQPLHGKKTSKGRVLFLAGENPQDVRGRFDALLRAHDLSLADVEGRVYFTQSPFNIDSHDSLKAFVQDASQYRPFDLCIIDTQKAHSGAEDEDDNGSSHALAMAMREMGRAIGDPCILTLSHPTKTPTKESLLPRGGSAFTGSIDGVLCLWRERRGDPSELFTHADKFRGQSFEGHFFNLEEVEHPAIVDNFGDPATSVVAKEASDCPAVGNLETTKQDIGRLVRRDKVLGAVVALEEGGLLCLRKQIKERVGGKSETFTDLMAGLLEEGALVEVPIPMDVHEKLGLNNSQKTVILPRVVNPDSYFNRLIPLHTKKGITEPTFAGGGHE